MAIYLHEADLFMPLVSTAGSSTQLLQRDALPSSAAALFPCYL